MALDLTNGRSRSASDILDKPTANNDGHEENLFTTNRYGTYTFKGLQEEKKRFDRKDQPIQRSTQNFVKKLIASLEKRNEACRADDEFFAKYYRRNLHPNTKAAPSCTDDQRFNEANNITHIREENSKITAAAKGDHSHINETVLTRLNKSESACRLNDQGSYRDRCRPFQFAYEANVQKEIDTREKKERRRSYGSSSFDPSRARVELQNHTEIVDSKKHIDHNREQNTLERLLSKTKEKKSAEGRTKFVRSKSFKDLFGTVISWRRSKKKKNPKRFMSCDHLIEQSNNFYNSGNEKMLSSSTSFRTVVPEDYGETNVGRNEERKATIHPIYGGKRNEQLLEVLWISKEDPTLFAMRDNTETLVKPSTIRDIAKCLSQFPDKPFNDNQRNESKELHITKHY